MTGWWLASYLVLWGLLVLVCTLLLLVLRQVGLIYLRGGTGLVQLDDGPEVGTPVRPFQELDDRSGEPVQFPVPGVRRTLIAFVSGTCGVCKDAVTGIRSAMRAGHDFGVLFIADGSPEDHHELRQSARGLGPFVTSLRRQRQLGITNLPYALLVDEGGILLAKGVLNSVIDVDDLLAAADRQLSAHD